ncbi:srpk, partial [Fusarium beomiforme]
MAEGLGQVVSWYICTVIACIFLILRIWVRVRKGLFGIDDGLIILSACCLIGDLIIQQHMWNLGMADMANASREDFIQIMKMIVPGSILYVTSLWAIKIALVLFYKRLAAPGTKLQMIYNITLGLLVIFWTTIFFHIIFQCFPHDKRWSQDPNYQCDPKEAEKNYWLTVILNIGTDVITISLPISMVLKLQMKTKQKIGVAAIFALGFLVVIAS